MSDFISLDSELASLQSEIAALEQVESARAREGQAAFASRVLGVPIPHDHPALPRILSGIESRGLTPDRVEPVMEHLLQRDLSQQRPRSVDDVASFLEITAALIRRNQ